MARQRTITRTISRNLIEVTAVNMQDLKVVQFTDIVPLEIDTATKYDNRTLKLGGSTEQIKTIDLKIVRTIEEKYEMLEDKFIELANKVE